MPFLDNLILGKPGGERRRRFAESGNTIKNGNAEERPGVGALLSTILNVQRRPAEDPAGGRRACGNPLCANGWTNRLKSREHPVFDGQWACGKGCLTAMVKAALTREAGEGGYEDGPQPHHHRIPLGLVMLAQGWITHPELQRALEAQRSHGTGRIGEWLVSECGMKPDRIARGLGAQWNCPVLSIEGFWPEAMALALPQVFLEEYGVVPLRVAGRKILYVGFENSKDASAVFALERMTGLRAESGVLPEAEFTRARETILRCEFPRQTMAMAGDRDGLARAIVETVEHEQPEASRLVRLHRYFWLRVWAKGGEASGAGDLPENANGVRDYLFTLGGTSAQRAVETGDESRPLAAIDRRDGVPAPLREAAEAARESSEERGLSSQSSRPSARRRKRATQTDVAPGTDSGPNNTGEVEESALASEGGTYAEGVAGPKASRQETVVGPKAVARQEAVAKQEFVADSKPARKPESARKPELIVAAAPEPASAPARELEAVEARLAEILTGREIYLEQTAQVKVRAPIESALLIEPRTTPRSVVTVEEPSIFELPLPQQSSERHYLARHEDWFDDEAGKVELRAPLQINPGTARVIQSNDPVVPVADRTNLQRFMRRGSDRQIEAALSAEPAGPVEASVPIEPIEGEYLPVELSDAGSTVPASEIQPSGWSRAGMLKRLKTSFPIRASRTISGPDRGV